MKNQTSELLSVAAKLRSNINAYKSQLEQANARLSEVRAQIGTLQREEAEIRHSPATREDFLMALHACIDHYAATGAQNVKHSLHAHLGHPPRHSRHVQQEDLEWQRVMEVAANGEGFVRQSTAEELLIAVSPNTYSRGGFESLFNVVSLCTLFGAQIKDAMTNLLNGIDWPYPNA